MSLRALSQRNFLSELMFWLSVRSPDCVSTNTAPVAVIAPTVIASELVNDKLPSLLPALPPAKLSTLLLVLLSVKVPVPFKPRLAAVMAPVCVTVPVAYKSRLLLVAVNAALMPMLPNWSD